MTDSPMLSGSWVLWKSREGTSSLEVVLEKRGVFCLVERVCVEYTERGVLFVGMRETA